MIILLLSIFLTGFIFNMIWELSHCKLYNTCIKMPKKRRYFLLIRMSVKDALFILLFYLITYRLYDNIYILQNFYQTLLFMLLCMTFSFFDETISIRLNRWEYNYKMPTILNVGISPLLEIMITGLVSLFITFLLT